MASLRAMYGPTAPPSWRAIADGSLPWERTRGLSGASGGTAPSPPDLAHLVGWYDSFRALGVGYTLSGGFIDSVLDLSGNGNHLTQATAANRPAIATAGAADGVHDAFDFTLNAGALAIVAKADLGLGTGPVSIYLAQQVPTNGRYFCDGATNNTRIIYGITSGVDLYAGVSLPTVAAVNGAWTIVAAVFNGAASMLAVNGAAPTTGNPGANTSPGHTWGGPAVSPAGAGANAMGSQCLIYTGAHDATQMAAVYAYLHTLTGI